MDYTQAFAISAAGMSLESARVNVAAMNLANANTVQGAGGVNYRPLRVVARAASMPQQADAAAFGSFGDIVQSGLKATQFSAQWRNTLPVATTEPMQSAPRLVYEPGHPAADAKGFVSYAGVDTAAEMITLMGAMRSYEANVAAMNTARGMALKALEIGGNS
jgi:flagellar basal-body rod protein FlgC